MDQYLPCAVDHSVHLTNARVPTAIRARVPGRSGHQIEHQGEEREKPFPQLGYTETPKEPVPGRVRAFTSVR